MARIKLTSGKSVDVQKEQAHEIWYVFNKEKQGTPEQVAFCEQIERIWLNLNNAPRSYIDKHLEEYKEWCKRDWPVDISGRPSRPVTTEQLAIASEYGLF